MNAILNHLWQATVLAACASLLGLALGRYRPVVRFRIWLVASLQFLFPLGLLIDLGGLLHRSHPVVAAASLPAMQIGAAFVVPASSAEISVPSASGGAIWPALLLGVWACGAIVVLSIWLREWLRIRALVRRAAPLDLGLPVRTVSGPARIELGVFGVLRPVLFVPEGLPESLSPGQLRAVLAHELCHIRRRDNLWTALHALVQAAFWFHPLVWWLGGRMTRDRELACDEAAVRLGAPAGVLLGPAQAPAPKSAVIPTAPLHFDAATVAVSPPGAQMENAYLNGGQAVFINASMRALIEAAYMHDGDRNAGEKLLGGPAWLPNNLYVVRAKTSAAATPTQMQQMLQTLLADRFALKVHMEQRPLPAFALTVSSASPKLKPAAATDTEGNCQGISSRFPGRAPIDAHCTSMSMSELAAQLQDMAPAYVDHPVVDRTGLTGKYDFELRWILPPFLRNPSDPQYDPSVDITMAESLAKLGLKLVPTTMPATVVVIDSVSPTPVKSAHPLPPMPAPPTAFEFAVIKPQGNLKPYGDRFTPGGGFDICCSALGGYISTAFNINLNTIVNPPKWLSSTSPDDRWDIEAKTVPGAAYGDELVMLQNLLKTRFGFVYHEETRRVPVYALRAGDHPRLKPTQGGRSYCNSLIAAENVNYTCTNMTMAQFAADLQRRYDIKKPVVDETGLKGAFDFTFTLAWRIPDVNNGASGQSAPATGAASTPIGAPLTVFDALPKQLGLKLVSDKQPVPVIVIDHLNRTPIPN